MASLFYSGKMSEGKNRLMGFSVVPYLKSNFGDGEVAVLINDALRALQVLVLGGCLPPVNEVALLVELPALVVKSMGDLVSNHKADGTIVHVPGAVVGEEDALENASGELCEIDLGLV
jgi:hypothetical protein